MPAYVLEADIELNEGREPALFRTIYVADEDEEPEIRARIERSLRDSGEWGVTSLRTRPPAGDERELADRLASGPRRSP